MSEHMNVKEMECVYWVPYKISVLCSPVPQRLCVVETPQKNNARVFSFAGLFVGGCQKLARRVVCCL